MIFRRKKLPEPPVQQPSVIVRIELPPPQKQVLVRGHWRRSPEEQRMRQRLKLAKKLQAEIERDTQEDET